MADIALFELDADGRWRLAFDDLQWVLQARRGKPGKKSSGYVGVSFIATEKRILLRVLREKGIDLTPEARARIDAMPPTFKAWLAAFQAQPQDREQDLAGEDARAA